MNMDIDVHLTQLLSSMTLDGTSRWGSAGIASEGQATSPTVGHQDATMSDASDTEDSSYQLEQPRSPSASSSCTKTADEPPPCGCALLQWLRGQLQAGQYATTGGDYLEIILTHRDAFYAFPDGHRTCAIGFSDIALDLERRETRPDRESDPEAAAAFRHEAIVIASSGIWSQPTI
ncbi:uncharacterized protein C8Q71DRAFT_725321 [Rhodofomes roseus]|uniref:Uncharacterized protein n=1 Tax=Rhodofomes roseus TaxID=34475 RepID=A0ABQ8K9R0_9APHY|nr:uncharacterized protein C8Q71DRAFT_725321 [Rhodofomes roseus]KAH9834116.1 hypothetical protein C8Q71DRAFT_725321 [Rhodofomes roseus]